MEMLCCMLVLRFVAAADVAADQANPQVDPFVADFEALLTTLRAGRHTLDQFDVRTPWAPP